ncbi:hypothetical protein Y1Q_0023826 [Alligator mississippiensis]|uniref:Uncharacterized protein n=1 Tax=Alligator mississippiensis TaxID=8496 RepID=A0A151MKC5_ALLMI|nr:hypothetical protein Y1Q_0023826 [Alligator mississippiensis]
MLKESEGWLSLIKNAPLAIKGLHAVGKHFDTVFIDADQREPANYYNFVLENHLLREDGVICMENTLMKGQVYLENISDENVLAVRKLNTVINSDPCVEQAISAMQEAGAKMPSVNLVLAKVEAVACELSLKGIKSNALAADVSKPEVVQRIAEAVVARWGTIHIVCLVLCCQAAGRIMLNQGYGKIINTASMASLIGQL